MVHLTIAAAMKIYRQRRKMTAYGMIVGKMRQQGEAWPVELDPIDSNGEPRTVVVPADWVEADEGRRSSHSKKKKKKKKSNRLKRTINSIQEDAQEDFDNKDDD